MQYKIFHENVYTKIFALFETTTNKFEALSGIEIGGVDYILKRQ